MTKLFIDQKKAIQKLKQVKVGALFMEPGTGKTRIAIELVKSTNFDFVLWVCPFQVKNTIEKELAKWGLDAFVVGIESIQQSDSIYLHVLGLCQNHETVFIILDESIKIKNSSANRTKRMLQLSKHSEYRLILNGTPLSKNLLDIYSQFQFLSPRVLKMSEDEFYQNFVEYIDIKDKAKILPDKRIIKKYHNLGHLYKLIEPFVFESRLSLFVSAQNIPVYFHLSDSEFEVHNELKNQFLDIDFLDVKNNNIFLELTTKMQQNYSLNQSKFKLLNKILKDVGSSKVLIFAKFIKTQNELKCRYPDLKVLSYQKHSFGLNLQNYNIVVFWEKTWDYAQREQAERRVYRTGQTVDCVFYDFTGNVGLERMIDDCIYKKRRLIDAFSNHNEL